MPHRYFPAIGLGLALGAASGAPASAQPVSAPQSFEAEIVGRDGNAIGNVLIRSGANATVVRVTVQAGGLTPGWHCIHFHRVGDCSDTGKFEKSGSHINTEGAKHGMLNDEGPDEGDLPNIFAAADGSVSAELSTHIITLEGEPALLDEDGSALVIHSNADDHATQPIGGAGDRIACAVIKSGA